MRERRRRPVAGRCRRRRHRRPGRGRRAAGVRPLVDGRWSSPARPRSDRGERCACRGGELDVRDLDAFEALAPTSAAGTGASTSSSTRRHRPRRRMETYAAEDGTTSSTATARAPTGCEVYRGTSSSARAASPRRDRRPAPVPEGGRAASSASERRGRGAARAGWRSIERGRCGRSRASPLCAAVAAHVVDPAEASLGGATSRRIRLTEPFRAAGAARSLRAGGARGARTPGTGRRYASRFGGVGRPLGATAWLTRGRLAPPVRWDAAAMGTADPAWRRLSALPLVIESYEFERLSAQMAYGFERVTTRIRLIGGGAEGLGEDVSPYRGRGRHAARDRAGAAAGRGVDARVVVRAARRARPVAGAAAVGHGDAGGATGPSSRRRSTSRSTRRAGRCTRWWGGSRAGCGS